MRGMDKRSEAALPMEEVFSLTSPLTQIPNLSFDAHNDDIFG